VSSKIPSRVQVFEVGARDGLQNEVCFISLQTKIEFVNRLIKSGIGELELGAFVRPDRVPQMRDTDSLYKAVQDKEIRLGKTRAWALVPNLIGLQRAIDSKAKNIAVFTAVSESFNRQNIGMDVSHSLKVISEIVREAKKHKIAVRGYVSTVFGCPFEGKVSPKQALRVIEALSDLGVNQVSVGDTIGVATPKSVEAVVRPALRSLGVKRIAVHFHDTRGTALANTLRSLELGVQTVDSSAGGLGGCPYAPGATGNLATEDLIYMLDGMGVSSGIDLRELCETSLWLSAKMNRPITSRYLSAYRASKSRQIGRRQKSAIG